MRVGDPALMLLRSDAHLDPKSESLIRAEILRALMIDQLLVATKCDDPILLSQRRALRRVSGGATD